MEEQAKQASNKGCFIAIAIIVIVVVGIFGIRLHLEHQKRQKNFIYDFSSIPTSSQPAVSDTVIFNGVKCYVVRRAPRYTHIVTEQRVSKNDLLPIADSLRVNTSTINFFLPNDLLSGDDWAAIIGRDLFIYDENLIVRIDRVVPDDRRVTTPRATSTPPPVSNSEIRATINNENRCRVMAEEFVRRQTISPRSTRFRGGVVHEPINDNTVRVLGRFTTRNAHNVELSYHYRIIMRFRGGEWTNSNNWEVVSLEFE